MKAFSSARDTSSKVKNSKVTWSFQLWQAHLSSHQVYTPWLALITICLSALQTVALSFESATLNVNSQFSEQTSFFKQVLGLFLWRGDFELTKLKPDVIILILLAGVYIFFLGSLFTLLILSITKRNNLLAGLESFYIKVGHAHIWLGVYPVHSICVQVFLACLNANSPVAHFIGLPLVTIVDILNITIALVQSKISLAIKTKDHFARSNEIYLVSCLIHKLVITITNLIALDSNDNISKIFAISVAFIFSVITPTLLFKSVPFYRTSLNWSALGIEIFNFALAGTSILNLLITGINSRTNIDTLLISGAILFVLVGINVYNQLEKALFSLPKLPAMPSSKYSNFQTYLLIQQVRHVKHLLSQALQPDSYEKAWTYQTLAKAGMAYEVPRLVNENLKYTTEIPSKEDRRKYLIEFLQKMVDLKPNNNLLKLFLARALIKLSQSIYEPFLLLQQVLTSHSKINHHLSAMFLQEQMKLAVKKHLREQKEIVDLVPYFENQQYYEEFIVLIEKQIASAEKFHQVLIAKQPSSLSIMNKSAELQHRQEKVHKFFDSIPNGAIMKNPNFYLTYSIYNACLNYDIQSARNNLQKYNNLMKKNIDNYKINNIEEKTLYDTQNMTFYMSAEKTNLGKIMNCSSNVKDYLKYNRENVIGRHFTTIIPSFYHSIRKDMYTRKLTSCDQASTIDVHYSFAQDTQGYILPIQKRITLYPNFDNGLQLWYLIRPLKTTLKYLLSSQQGNIEGFSQEFGEELGLDPKEKLTMSMISPQLARVDGLLDIMALERATRTDFSKEDLDLADEGEMMFQDNKHSLLLDAAKMESAMEIASSKASINFELRNMGQQIQEKGIVFPFISQKVKGDKEVHYLCKVSIKNFRGKILKIIALVKQEHPDEVSQRDYFSFPVLQEASEKTLEHKKKISPQTTDQKTLDDSCNDDIPNEYVKPPIISYKSAETNDLPIDSVKRVLIQVPTEKRRTVIIAQDNKSSERSKKKSNQEIGAYSSQSEMSKAKKVRSLISLTPKFQFYRFKSAKIPFIAGSVFLLGFIISLWLVYEGANSSIPKIEGSVEVSHLLLQRSNSLYQVMRVLALIYLYRLLGSDIAPIAYNSTLVIPALQEANLKLSDQIEVLEPETQEWFYDNNVRMFYGGYQNLNESNDYTLFDSINSVSSIISAGLYFINHSVSYEPYDTKYIEAQEYLYFNLFNDIAMKNRELVDKIQIDVESKVNSIQDRSAAQSTILIILFVIAGVIILMYFYQIYTKTAQFINYFANGNYEDELEFMNHTIAQVKRFLRYNNLINIAKESQTMRIHALHIEKQAKANQFVRQKHLKNKELFFLFFGRFAVTFGCLLGTLMLLISSNNHFNSQAQKILPMMNDITQAGKIACDIEQAVSQIGLVISRQDVPSMFQNVTSRFMSDIDAITTLIDKEHNEFTADFEEILNEDFCSLVIENIPRCEVIGNGAAKNGFIGAIYYLQNELYNFINLYNSIPDSPWKLYQVLTGFTNIYDLYEMTYFGVADGLAIVNDNRAKELKEILSEGTNIIIQYSIWGLVMAIILALFSWLYMYPKLVNERKRVCKSLLLVPSYLVTKNKFMKEFLLKDSKNFFSFIKNNQENWETYSIHQLAEIKQRKVKLMR